MTCSSANEPTGEKHTHTNITDHNKESLSKTIMQDSDVLKYFPGATIAKIACKSVTYD